MSTITCSGCGGDLEVGTLEPGTRFACGGCETMLTVPAAAAPAHPARRDRVERRAPATSGRRRRREPTPPAEGRRLPVGLLVGAGVGLVAAIGLAAALMGGDPPPADDAPEPALTTAAGAPDGPAADPLAGLSPDERAWAEADSESSRLAWFEGRLATARKSDEEAAILHAFAIERLRLDLARRSAEARLAEDPESAWANEKLGRTDLRPDLEALADEPKIDLFPIEAWDRLAARLEEGRTWIGEGEEREAVDADLAAVRAHLESLEDRWTLEMLATAKVLKAHPTFEDFTPIDHISFPPYLVLAQRQQDEMKHSTQNVLENHAKLFKCLTGNFLAIMEEAGLPTPTVEEMGNPVLRAFVFTDRNAFDRWHWKQGWPEDALKGVRAYYSWGGNQFMMLYDTGAPTATQDDDTCTAFHEATHQLVHYYRRYYLTLEDRKRDPDAPEVKLLDPRLHGRTHWFGEGFAEFFGAADRISSVTGEWKLFRPLKKRIKEWGSPYRRSQPQWTIEQVLCMKSKAEMNAKAEELFPEDRHAMQSLYYAQAWALNHYLYFAHDGKWRRRYLLAVNEEMRCNSGFEVFLQCFGIGKDPEERRAFLDHLDDEVKKHQNELLMSLY